MHAFRSHTCAALTAANTGETVRLSGWVHRRRDHGGVIFIDLRDHYGITQVLCDPDSPVFAQVERLRSEFCIRIDGTVKARDPDLVNPKLPTGEIEVFIRDMEILGGVSGDLPLQVFGDQDYPEETRLKISLSRPAPRGDAGQHDASVGRGRPRSVAACGTRDFVNTRRRSSPRRRPRRARDFLVPSRLHPGKFYALPQAPQQFKAIAHGLGLRPLFPDRALFPRRKTRVPTARPPISTSSTWRCPSSSRRMCSTRIEPVLKGVFEEFGKGPHGRPGLAAHLLSRCQRCGTATDKPDLRNPIKMQIVSDHFAGSGFAIFARILEQDGTEVRAIPAPGGGSRKFLRPDELLGPERGPAWDGLHLLARR